MDNLAHLVNSRHPFVWIDTAEYMRCIMQQKAILRRAFKDNLQLYLWDSVTGLSRLDETEMSIINSDLTIDNPVSPVEIALEHAVINNPKAASESRYVVLFMLDYHVHIAAQPVWRSLLNCIPGMQKNCMTVVFISPETGSIPRAIERYITIIDMPLPDFDELMAICRKACPDVSEAELCETVETGLGLTEFEFTNAVRVSLSELGHLDDKHIHKQKEQLIRRGSGLSIYRNNKGFEHLIGMDNMKQFTYDMINSGKGRGILILGVPGTGKSEFAKCLGYETGRLTVVMDIGAMKDKYVGSTERRTRESLKIIDAVGRAVLFVDEIEKSLAGVGAETTDSGTSQGQGGEFLKWTNDHTSDVYLVATANDISKLPPEYLRSGRWDAIFFVDIPNRQERALLLQYYKNVFGLTDNTVDENDLEGWTGAEIESLCLKASARNNSLEENIEFVTPICKVASTKIVELRNWAVDRTVPATKKGTEGR